MRSLHWKGTLTDPTGRPHRGPAPPNGYTTEGDAHEPPHTRARPITTTSRTRQLDRLRPRILRLRRLRHRRRHRTQPHLLPRRHRRHRHPQIHGRCGCRLRCAPFRRHDRWTPRRPLRPPIRPHAHPLPDGQCHLRHRLSADLQPGGHSGPHPTGGLPYASGPLRRR